MVDGVEEHLVAEPGAHEIREPDVPVALLFPFPGLGVPEDGRQVVVAGRIGVQVQVHDLPVGQPPGQEVLQEAVLVVDYPAGSPKGPIPLEEQVGQAQPGVPGGSAASRTSLARPPQWASSRWYKKRPHRARSSAGTGWRV